MNIESLSKSTPRIVDVGLDPTVAGSAGPAIESMGVNKHAVLPDEITTVLFRGQDVDRDAKAPDGVRAGRIDRESYDPRDISRISVVFSPSSSARVGILSMGSPLRGWDAQMGVDVLGTPLAPPSSTMSTATVVLVFFVDNNARLDFSENPNTWTALPGTLVYARTLTPREKAKTLPMSALFSPTTPLSPSSGMAVAIVLPPETESHNRIFASASHRGWHRWAGARIFTSGSRDASGIGINVASFALEFNTSAVPRITGAWSEVKGARATYQLGSSDVVVAHRRVTTQGTIDRPLPDFPWGEDATTPARGVIPGWTGLPTDNPDGVVVLQFNAQPAGVELIPLPDDVAAPFNDLSLVKGSRALLQRGLAASEHALAVAIYFKWDNVPDATRTWRAVRDARVLTRVLTPTQREFVRNVGGSVLGRTPIRTQEGTIGTVRGADLAGVLPGADDLLLVLIIEPDRITADATDASDTEAIFETDAEILAGTLDSNEDVTLGPISLAVRVKVDPEAVVGHSFHWDVVPRASVEVRVGENADEAIDARERRADVEANTGFLSRLMGRITSTSSASAMSAKRMFAFVGPPAPQ